MQTFYERVNRIDALIGLGSPSQSEINELLSFLGLQAEASYFYRSCGNPAWFDILQDKTIFTIIPAPITGKDNTVSFPVWWPGVYLVKVADKIPGKVSSLIKDLKTENLNAINLAMEAALKMPIEHSKQLIASIDRWLDSKYQTLINHHAIELLGKYLEAKEYDASFQLLEILSKPSKNKPADRTFYSPKLRYDDYEYREQVIKKFVPLLSQYDCKKIVVIFDALLKEGVELAASDNEYDAAFWRDAIEKDEPTYNDDIRNMFTDILRDAIGLLVKQSPPDAQAIIKRYLEDKHSIFKRLAIHAVRINDLDELGREVMGDKDNLYDYLIYHEYYLLVRDKFKILSKDAQKQFIRWLLEGAKKKDGSYDAKDFNWIKRRLSMVKESVMSDPLLAEFVPIIKEYKLDTTNVEHAESLIYSSDVHVGPTSPLNKEAMSKKTADEFVEFIKTFNPSKDFAQPTPEGLGRIFDEVVKDDPEKYANKAERFLESGIYPTYIVYLIRGFEDAWKANKSFNWAPVLSLCEEVMKRQDDEAIKSRDDFNYGRISWAKGAISNLLGEAVRRDEHVIPDEHLPRVKGILFYILSNDPDPTPEDETKYGGDNMDFVTYAINCNRGKAQEALILYALRYARIHASKEDEKAKDPFPAGERLENDVKDFLGERMKKESSPSVHSVFGRFLPHLYYLDQKWVEGKIVEGSLFSPKNDLLWRADWQGYMFVGNFYNKLYILLRDQGFYKKAILATKEKANQEGRSLAEHLMVAFWRSLEDFNAKDGLLKLFFDSAPLDARQRAIYCLGSAIDTANDIPKFKEIWPRLRALWESRLKEAKDDEAVAFVTTWLRSAPESIEGLSGLIQESIRHKKDPYREHRILEYIHFNVEKFPKASMEILIVLLRRYAASPGIYISDRDIRPIIDKAKHSNKCNDLVNEAVNILGELGEYGYRDLLVQKE